MGILNDEDRKRDEEHADEDRMASYLEYNLRVEVINRKLNDGQRAALQSILRQQLAELCIKLSFFVEGDSTRVKLLLGNARYGVRELHPEVEDGAEQTAA
jgi:hypothetical protein